MLQPLPDCPANTLNNDEWLSFEAASSTISLLITPTNCQGTNGQFGMQGAIYESCGGMAVATQCECTESPFLLEANLNPGQVYYLVLDGCAGDICDFSVEMLEGSTACQPIIVGPTSVCLGDTVVYVLNGVGSSANIEWLPIPNASTSINGNNLEVVWNTYYDSSLVCALVTDTNQVSQLLCLHVQINQPFPANVYGPTMPCVGNMSVYTALDNEYCNEVPNLFWTVSSGGDLLSSPNPSSIQVQWTDQGLQEVCLHQIFGTDTVTSCLGVNVLPMLHATILVGNPPMPFNADSTIHLCPTDSLNLTALISDSNGNPYPDSAFNFRWLIEGNQFLSGKNLSVKLPAGNCYKVNLDASILLGCQVQDTSLNVEIASIPVAVEIFPAPPICEGESVTLSATTLPYAPLPCEDNPGGDASNNTNLAIPDGDGTSVESVIHVDIPQAGVLAPNQLKAICANLEHSWMRDLEVTLTCPNGQTAILHNHPGQIGGEFYLGIPYQNDEGLPTPFPGTGYPYCWTPDGNQTWIQYANSHPSNYTLPSGNYQSFQPLSIFNGCPINGDWTLTVTDRWAIDNGYLFYWSLDFGYGISGTQTLSSIGSPTTASRFIPTTVS
ncbi:MAG: proprotein convertase P-domain-containing protein [Saprospiraceae bacterium]|nr:proprotein convertase P-domain-containing protein [Saprospiraceae bacterium]